jgi:HK97 family phage major capsid protein
MGLTLISNELNEDSVVALGDEAIRQFTEAQTNTEDTAGFLGDGTSTYHGIFGIIPKLTALTAAGIKNAASGSNDDWSVITLANLQQLPAVLPEYPGMNPKWYCHKAFWATVMEPLALAAGGNTVTEIQNGVPVKRFLGYDVVISQVLPNTADTAEIVCLFGDLRMGSMLGDRKGGQIAMSTDATVGGVSVFGTDQIAMLYVTRFGINNHSLGSSSAVETFAALKTAS